MVVDPVTHLGRYWILGDLCHYEHPDWHFDVPFANYLGWLVTCAAIVGINQLADRWLRPAPDAAVVGGRLPLQPFWSLATIAGNMGFMLLLTDQLLRTPSVPSDTPLAAMLLLGVGLTATFVAFCTVMVRRGFTRPLRD